MREVLIDRDERRELLTLQVKGRDGTSHPARALSDGTLRFLALVVLGLDPGAQGLICLEEPENGIHPERIAAMLRLLQDIATDTSRPVGPDNPLRQVIINTHSPSVVARVLDDTLLIAEPKETVKDGKRFRRVSFSHLDKAWRVKADASNLEQVQVIFGGKMISYLNPFPSPEMVAVQHGRSSRVVDRPDLQNIVMSFSQE